MELGHVAERENLFGFPVLSLFKERVLLLAAVEFTVEAALVFGKLLIKIGIVSFV